MASLVIITTLPVPSLLCSSACRGCVTPKQIINLKTTTGGDATELDGYDELPEGFQTKVKEAIVNGHVDDEDWNGVR